jgi:hypothetical protein
MARKQTLRARIRATVRRADHALRVRFAPYVALDDYGTFQMCYTAREAMEWLPCLAPCSGRILFGARTIARRVQA